MDISDSFFQNITSSQTSFDISQTSLYLTNCTFDSIINLNIRGDSSSIFMNKIIFQNVQCQNLDSGCVLTCTFETSLEINNSIFANISNVNLLGNIYLENSEAFIYNNIFNNLYANKINGACFYSENSNITIEESLFSSYYENCLYMVSTIAYLTNSTFDNQNLNSSQGNFNWGALYCELCLLFELNGSIIRKNKNSNTGGGVALINNANSNTCSFLVINCFFEENEAGSGGAIFISEMAGKIISTTFLSNNALYGGAIYYLTNGNFLII